MDGYSIKETAYDSTFNKGEINRRSPVYKKDGASALDVIIKGVNKNLDLSVSGVLVFGDETFDDVTDYEYWFDTCTVSGLSGKVSYSRSDCCKTISVGKKMNKTSFGINYSNSYYFVL